MAESLEAMWNVRRDGDDDLIYCRAKKVPGQRSAGQSLDGVCTEGL